LENVFFNHVLKNFLGRGTSSIINGTLGFRGTPVGKHCTNATTRGVHGLDFDFFGSGLRLLTTGSVVSFSLL